MRRWYDIVVREKENKKKSFSSNVSASDIGFSFYLLEYYSKSAILFKKFNEKEKKSRWSKDVLDESLDFYTKSSMEARTMYTKMTEKKKRDLDEKVIGLLREDIVSDDDNNSSPNRGSDHNNKEKKEVYADCSFFDDEEEE